MPANLRRVVAMLGVAAGTLFALLLLTMPGSVAYDAPAAEAGGPRRATTSSACSPIKGRERWPSCR